MKVEANRDMTVRGGSAESVGSVKKGATIRGNNMRAKGGGSERGVRNLPYSEYLKRREEGKCFTCGGPFRPGHRCPERGLRMLILAEEEKESENEGEEELNVAIMELSALSAGGLTSPRTMKLRGRMGHREVLVLIDSGASHNFVSRRLMMETQPYLVSLGDGQRKRISGCCEQVALEMGEAKVVERFYLFELGGVEVILGVEWLEKLGEVTVDWRELTMKYRQGDKRITLKGDPTLERRVVGPQALQKIDEVAVWLLVWKLSSCETHTSGPKCSGMTERQRQQRCSAMTEQQMCSGLTERQKQ